MVYLIKLQGKEGDNNFLEALVFVFQLKRRQGVHSRWLVCIRMEVTQIMAGLGWGKLEEKRKL